MEYDFLIKTQTDKSIFDAVTTALETLDLSYTLNANLITHNTEQYESNSPEKNAQLEQVLEANSELVTKFIFNVDVNMKITIDRDRNNRLTTCKFRPTVANEKHSEVWAKPVWLPLILDLRTRLVAVDSQVYGETVIGKELADHYTRRDEELSKLVSVVEKATDKLAKHQKEVDKTIAANEKRYREEQAKRDKEKDKEVAELKAKLDEKQKILEEREAQLDDRDNVHVRRELRTQWQERIEKRFHEFKLTKGLQDMRRPMALLIFLGLCVSAIFTFMSLRILYTDAIHSVDLVSIAAILKSVVGGIAFFGLLSYYLRWQNKWIERHAKAEFGHMQMALDIDRASWVAEMALEWSKEGNQPIPDELLAQLTRNMFTSEGAAMDLKHSKSDDFLLTLLGASSKLEVDVAGSKATLNRRGCKEIAKEMGKPESE